MVISLNPHQKQLIGQLMDLHTDEVMSILAKLGLDVDFELTPEQNYSEKTRKRAVWPRVEKAFRENIPESYSHSLLITFEASRWWRCASKPLSSRKCSHSPPITFEWSRCDLRGRRGFECNRLFSSGMRELKPMASLMRQLSLVAENQYLVALALGR